MGHTGNDHNMQRGGTSRQNAALQDRIRDVNSRYNTNGRIKLNPHTVADVRVHGPKGKLKRGTANRHVQHRLIKWTHALIPSQGLKGRNKPASTTKIICLSPTSCILGRNPRVPRPWY